MIGDCVRSGIGKAIEYPDTRPGPDMARRLRGSPTRDPLGG